MDWNYLRIVQRLRDLDRWDTGAQSFLNGLQLLRVHPDNLEGSEFEPSSGLLLHWAGIVSAGLRVSRAPEPGRGQSQDGTGSSFEH